MKEIRTQKKERGTGRGKAKRYKQKSQTDTEQRQILQKAETQRNTQDAEYSTGKKNLVS